MSLDWTVVNELETKVNNAKVNT